MRKAKILMFVDRLRVGGIQTLLLEIVEHINRDKFDIDLLLLDDGIHYDLEEKFSSLNCNVHKLNGIWIKRPWDYYLYAKRLDIFFKNHNDYIAVHMNSSSKNFLVLYYAYKYGIKLRIAHSHNTGFQTKSTLQIAIGTILKIPLKRYTNYFLACSKYAGQWLFGNDVLNSDRFAVLKNGIDVDKFVFSETKRAEVRRMLGIDSALVVGHVGRFTKQKNHTFLIDIFVEFCKSNRNSVLMLIGTGEEEEHIRDKVNTLGLREKVVFVGYRDNVSDYMQAMDLFVFPSLYEGLGIVLIEAQASGLPCYTSKDVVPKEAKVTELLDFISLDAGVQVWAERMQKHPKNRRSYQDEIKKQGYDINDTSRQLEKLYCAIEGDNIE